VILQKMQEEILKTFKMAITIFSQIGKGFDGILNWFINLNSIWQLIAFAVIVLIGVMIYFYLRR